MHENLFDMNHQFLHRSLMGSVKATCLDRRSGEDWCEVDYTFTRKAGRANDGRKRHPQRHAAKKDDGDAT